MDIRFPVILDSLVSCGVTHVEPAFIVGYTEPFDESAFNATQSQSSLHCG